MTFATSDLTPLLQPAPGAQMRYAAGTIVAWNPATFENIVDLRGVPLVNVPVLSGPAGLTYREGDVVALMGSDPAGRRGVASYAVIGRLVVPGPGVAAEAIAYMTTELGEALAASIFSDRITNDRVTGTLFFDDSVPNTDWIDGSSQGSEGPVVSSRITSTGRALAIVSASIRVKDTGNVQMSLEVESQGNVTHEPSDIRANAAMWTNTEDSIQANITGVSVIEDLAEGVNTFTAMYRWSFIETSTQPQGVLVNRNLTIIGF